MAKIALSNGRIIKILFENMTIETAKAIARRMNTLNAIIKRNGKNSSFVYMVIEK